MNYVLKICPWRKSPTHSPCSEMTLLTVLLKPNLSLHLLTGDTLPNPSLSSPSPPPSCASHFSWSLSTTASCPRCPRAWAGADELTKLPPAAAPAPPCSPLGPMRVLTFTPQLPAGPTGHKSACAGLSVSVVVPSGRPSFCV